jgi:hypothetical protein
MSERLNLYIVPPQQEFRAANELQESGIGYELLTETVTYQRSGSRKPVERTVPLIRGYLPAEGKPHDAKHLRRSIGTVSRSDLIRVVSNRDRGHVPAPAFAPGDNVLIERGPFAALPGVVVQLAGRRGWLVDVALFGRTTRAAVAQHYMRKHDPGG